MKTERQVKGLLYLFGWVISFIYIRLFYRFRIYGKENIPSRKPFIICANHVNLIDPMIVGIAFPPSYKVHFMAKGELFKNPIISLLLYGLCAFPVDREEKGHTALKNSFSLLKKGKILGLFPEGSRSKDGKLQKAREGAAVIAVRSGYPVLPVAINSSYRKFNSVEVHIGKPFVLPPLKITNRVERKEALEEMSCKIMAHIGKLLSKN